jgi:REP element-mobilizing transposase RayT
MRISRNPQRRLYGRSELHLILEEVRNRQRFEPLGYVLMPEHIHLLISEG